MANRLLINNIPAYTSATVTRLREVVSAAAGTIAANAAASMEGQEPPSDPGSPPAIRSGLLHGSIRSTGNTTSREIEYYAFTDVEYAQHLEYGTIFMEARPFMRPAAEKVRPSYEAACRAVMRRSGVL